jgi:hypothetical protein
MIEKNKNQERLIDVFERLESLINEFAAVERATSRLVGELKPCKVRDVIDEAIDIAMAEESNLAIEAVDDVTIRADFKLLAIACKNMIDNALKYSDDKFVKITITHNEIIFSSKGKPLESDLKYVSDIYTSILGNSQNSRLFKILREKLGLVYSVYAFNDMRMNSGEVYIIFGTRAQNVKKAIKVIKTEMENLSKNGITDIELQRAKNWKESCVAFGLESSAEIAELNGSYTHYFGKPTSAEEKIQNYRVVTKEQVDEFAKKIYVEEVFNIVAVGQNIKLDDLKQF